MLTSLNKLFCKKELWFLQTHLTPKELKNFEYQYEKIFLNKVTFRKLIEIVTHKKERYNHLINLYENYYSNEKNLISKYELEKIMNKKLNTYTPCIFNFAGHTEILKKPLVAIIGSRRPTFYGREQCYRFSKAFAKKGFTVISGGAIGIDSIANSVALETGAGSCAILGSGLNQLYPPSNLFLFKKLKENKNGLILSEFFENEPPQKWNFPKRNHSIALLADFVLIVEAAFTSGSLITANAALDYGTDVGAIPGCVDSINSEGVNSLIQNGAFCIQKPEDVIERVEYIYHQRIK